MKHAIRVSEAFELVNSGPPKSRKAEKDSDTPKPSAKAGSSSNKTARKSDDSSKGSGTTKKPPPGPCPLPKCKGKNRLHWISECTVHNDAEKKQHRVDIAAEKARDGPSKSTRSQTAEPAAAIKFVKRLQDGSESGKANFDSPACRMTLKASTASHDLTGRCDDGSDESIVAPSVAEKAVLKGVGYMETIDKVCLEVALKKEESKPALYTFSRAWTVPSTILHLFAGQLALKNIRYLVADDALTCKDLLIGLPVLRHLRIDTRTLLENNIANLDGTNCSLADSRSTTKGNLGRLMTAMLNRQVDRNVSKSSNAPPNRPRVHYNSARNEEEPFPDPSLLDPVDADQHEEIKSVAETMVESAKKNGLSDERHNELKKTVLDHMDIFRCSFSAGPPAKLPPLKIDLTADAKPVKVRLRNYSADQRRFLGVFVKSLVSHGMAYPNPTSKWACAPLLVPKPGAEFRFTTDLRPVNKHTINHQYPMPNLEHELTNLGKEKPQCFANFDMSHSYWQLMLASESQECHSIITPDGTFTPNRVMYGTTNAVTHLQSSLTSIIPDEWKPNILIWLDDILLFAPTVEKLLMSIRSFFRLCVSYNIKLHPAKCILYTTEVRWCGRLVTPDGVRYDPRRLDALKSMEPPTTGAHLQQFLCALQWVKKGIPNFTELVAPLHDFMETIYALAEKRTKRAVTCVILSDQGWGKDQLNAFEACKSALTNQVTLSHRDPSQRLCVYTDASDMVWSGIITQVPVIDVSKPHKEQRHSPLSFLSARFNMTQQGWSTVEKEAFAVLNTLDRMHWLVTNPDGFDLYTDHNNLIFLFDPLSVVPDLSQTSLRKVLRWAVRLSIYQYTCYHIKGEENVWADLLTRWSNANRTVRRLVHIPELPSACSDDFEWPSAKDIADVQQEYSPTAHRN